jgi:putative transport protein
MQGVFDLLAKSQPLLLFTVIGIGYIVGQIRIMGFHLGVAAVLFVGLTLSALDNRLVLDEVVFTLGIVLCVYTIGLQSGPVFFATLQKSGRNANILALITLLSAGIATGAMCYALGLSGPLTAGLFCGATTNTPALASANEALGLKYDNQVRVLDEREGDAKHPSDDVRKKEREKLLVQPTVGYSLAYPFGVLGLLIGIQLAHFIGRPNYREEELLERGDDPTGMGEMIRRTVLVRNCTAQKPAFAAAPLAADLGVVFTRLERGGQVKVVLEHDVLVNDDTVIVVGTDKSVARAVAALGEESGERLDLQDEQIERRSFIVSNRELMGTRIQDVAMDQYGARISRVQRSGLPQPAQPDTIIQPGDQVVVVAPAQKMAEIATYLGNSFRSIAETDFLSIALGLVIGVLVGMIPIPLPGGTVFKLGFAGGPLLVALVLGRIVRTGGIVWGLPPNANLTLRQVGLLFFLAGIGTKAGVGFAETFREHGIRLILAGAVITTVGAVTCLILGRLAFKFSYLGCYGILTGTGTQPAALMYAHQLTMADHVLVAYGSVYPLAMIVKIIIAQLLINILPLP